MDARHGPDSARFCELAFRAVGAARRHPLGGVPRALLRGVWGEALTPPPRFSVLGASSRGSLPK